MDASQLNNFSMPFNWFAEIKEALGEAFEPAAHFLGRMMPFGPIKGSEMQAMGVIAWLSYRGLTVEKLYEEPRYFQELRIAMAANAIGVFKTDPESSQKLINLAMAGEHILKGVKDKVPWEAIEQSLKDLAIAA
jgi:hypothetical protein